MQSRASVSTEKSSRYLQRLCKHWSHRFEVRFDLRQGHVDFGNGRTLDLSSGSEKLELTISEQDSARIPEMEKVVEDHLKRFAFRETLVFEWTRGENAAG